MTNSQTVKPPVWFWVVSVIALLWNLMGVMNYLGQAFMKEELQAQMPSDQVALMENTPAWVTAAFAIAVWGGAIGCIGLLLRKKWGKAALAISLLGILVQMGYAFFMTNAAEVYGQTQGIIIPLLVITIGVFLLLFARFSDKKMWLS